MASLSKVEQDNAMELVLRLMREINSLKKKPSVEQFFQSDEGQHLLKFSIQASLKKQGSRRNNMIAKLTASGMVQSVYAYSVLDFIDMVSELNEPELNLLMTAYELYDKKDSIGKERKDSLVAPDIKTWTELHARFPEIPPIEMVALFIRMQRTGLVQRAQGFMDDSGDTFEFTPILKKLIDYANLDRESVDETLSPTNSQ
nr:hypothetical protein CKG001_02150 [Bdellovibrio sp. CKG001]